MLPWHLACLILVQALFFSVSPPSLCLSDSLLELSVCVSLVTCSLVSAHLQQLDLSAPLGTWLRLLALQSSSSILNFLEANAAQLGSATRPLSSQLWPGAGVPQPFSRGLRTGSLRRWDSSAGGPLGMDPQVPHSFAPGLPGNLGKTEPELSLRTEKIGSPPSLTPVSRFFKCIECQVASSSGSLVLPAAFAEETVISRSGVPVLDA